MTNPKRRRIVFVHYRDSAAIGGSLRVGETVANHLARLNLDPHVVFAYGGPGPVARSTRATCHFLRASGPADPRAWVRARHSIASLNADVIHYMDAVFWVRAALLGCGIPSVVHVHGPILDECTAARDHLLWRALAHLSTGHVCITGHMRDLLLRHGWGDPRRTWVVPNGIDVERFSRLPARDALRRRFGLPEDAFVLGMVCRLVPEKGCEEVVDLLPLLPRRFHALLCGEGPLAPALERAVRDAGLTERVHFAGRVDDAREAYAAMDALLFLSRHEPFGLILAEAMAARVPILGLAGDGGYRECPTPLVTPANSLLLERPPRTDFFAAEPQATAAALAAHILRATSLPGLLEDRAGAAYAWVCRHFDARRQAEALAELYENLVLPGGLAA